MVEFEHIKSCGCVYIKYLSPWTFRDTLQVCEELSQEGNGTTALSSPMLVDLRDAEMIKLDAASMRRHARELRRVAPMFANNWVAYLEKDASDYGMMRMFSAYNEIEGIRSMDHVLVTEDVTEAIVWISCEASATQRACQNALFDRLRIAVL